MPSALPKLSIDFPGEDVADVTNRFHQHWIFRVGFDFFSEAGDLRVDGAVESAAASAPCQIHQCFATKDAAWMSGEGGEEVEFASGKRDVFT